RRRAQHPWRIDYSFGLATFAGLFMNALDERLPRISFNFIYPRLGVWSGLAWACFFAVILPVTAWTAESASVNATPVRVALRAGKLLTVRNGETLTNVVILLEGDRIAALGGTVPASVQVIDLSNYTVLPGLVDCHAHILGNPKDESPTANLRMSSPQAAIW